MTSSTRRGFLGALGIGVAGAALAPVLKFAPRPVPVMTEAVATTLTKYKKFAVGIIVPDELLSDMQK